MKLPASLASSLQRYWNTIPASALFVAVLISFPPFLFQKKLGILAAEATTFFLLALSRRGKIRLLPSLLLIASITLFALFSPHGQVVARLGNFTITKGALEAGLSRGISLAGMVFLSQLALVPDLALPGRVGDFVVKMFSLLEELGKNPLENQGKKKSWSLKSIKNIVLALDQRLYHLYWHSCSLTPAQKPKSNKNCKTPNLGWLFFALPVVLYLLLL